MGTGLPSEADAVVVGAGVVGLSAALALARRGRRVVVVEAATMGHSGGGSRGSARVFRLGYDDPLYVEMAKASEPMWRDLEEDAGLSEGDLLRVTGQVTAGDGLDGLAAAMASAGAAPQRLSAAERRRRFPGLALATGGDGCLFEPRSGVLAADRCLVALRELAESAGATVFEQTLVTRIGDDGRRVRVACAPVARGDGSAAVADTTVEAQVVVVCVGSLAPTLLGGLVAAVPTVTTLEQVVYLRRRATAREGAGAHASSVPVFINRQDPWVYGLPVPRSEVGLVKLAFHRAGRVIEPGPAGTPVDETADSELVARLEECARRLLPEHDPEPVATERCCYDMTPDEDFVLDRVGNVVVGHGTSGHGFKFGPLLGVVLADLAEHGVPAESRRRCPALESARLRFSLGRLGTLG